MDPGMTMIFLYYCLSFLVGWYSVCPESLAEYIAERFFKTLGPNALIMDGMGGMLFCFTLF